MAVTGRLDTAVFALGLAESREKAKAYIMAGQVYLNGRKADKPGEPVKPDDRVELRGEPMRYVSRGGYKLEKALAVFGLSLSGNICADVGASTGGFCDCMLQNGAAKVYAVDVGYGQFDWKLRTDPRVICLERTNFRYVTRAQIPEPLDFASADVSFISLSKILPALYPLLKPGARAVCLIKPQFEAERARVGKHGVVRDPAVHESVIRRVLADAAEIGLFAAGLTFSPITGPQGNIEYLAHLQKRDPPAGAGTVNIAGVVADAHGALAKGVAP